MALCEVHIGVYDTVLRLKEIEVRFLVKLLNRG